MIQVPFIVLLAIAGGSLVVGFVLGVAVAAAFLIEEQSNEKDDDDGETD